MQVVREKEIRNQKKKKAVIHESEIKVADVKKHNCLNKK